MREIIVALLLFIPSLTGCTAKYHESMQSINQSIADANARSDEACATALLAAKDSPTTLVSIALTVCKDKQEFLAVAPPEKVGDIIKQLSIGLVPWAFVQMGRSASGPTSYDVGGDYVSNIGEGSAGTSRTYPTEVIIMGEE